MCSRYKVRYAVPAVKSSLRQGGVGVAHGPRGQGCRRPGVGQLHAAGAHIELHGAGWTGRLCVWIRSACLDPSHLPPPCWDTPSLLCTTLPLQAHGSVVEPYVPPKPYTHWNVLADPELEKRTKYFNHRREGGEISKSKSERQGIIIAGTRVWCCSVAAGVDVESSIRWPLSTGATRCSAVAKRRLCSSACRARAACRA